MSVYNIITDRLIIIPMTYSIVCSVLDNKSNELEKLGIQVNGKWPLKDTFDILRFIKDSMKKNGDASGFDVWMLIKKEDMTVVGDIGFKGEPNDNGEVEIGFGLIKEEQRKGYGYEAASSIIHWATQQPNVNIILADCLIDNEGSRKILEKCGLYEIKRDKELIYWEKRLK